jgi:NADP-dependent 3-hydroxy acid dehydrogenase YdfG
MEKNKNDINTSIALAEKTVVIIGASSGIGRATALAFAKEGTTLILVARRERVLQELALECKRHGARMAVPVCADVTEAESLQQVVEAAMQAMCGSTMRVLEPWVTLTKFPLRYTNK